MSEKREYVGHIGFWPRTDQMPSYVVYDATPNEVTLRLGSGWSVHLPMTAEGGAYLRRLAAIVATCAGVVEEVSSRPNS